MDQDQRFSFLVTFIKKNIIQENGLERKIFVLGLEETRNKDKSQAFWWEPTFRNRNAED